MIDLDPFDHQIAEFETDFSKSIREAFDKAIATIDMDAVVAAIISDDDGALAIAMNLDEGLNSTLDSALMNGLFYALLGAAILSMKRFAASHRSRVNPDLDIARLSHDIEHNIIQPLSRRAFQAPLTAFSELRKTGMQPRVIAEAVVRAISLAPDQARSSARFVRVFHEAVNSPDRTVDGAAIVIPPMTAKRIINRHAGHLNAAQRSALRRVLAGQMKTDEIQRMIIRHDRALTSYRQSVIARQEAVRAIHVGEYLAFRQGKANRTIPRDARRYWKTRGDERVRHDHRMVPQMNPNGVDVGQAFKTPLGSVMHPPLEVNCRCRIVVRRPSEREAIQIQKGSV